jgi:hypothetical protein
MRIHIHVATQDAEKFVEAMPDRIEFRFVAEMPFMNLRS